MAGGPLRYDSPKLQSDEVVQQDISDHMGVADLLGLGPHQNVHDYSYCLVRPDALAKSHYV